MESLMANLPSAELYKAGQGPWLDTISRKILRSGQLKEWIGKGLLGVTSNPSIFQQAISQGEGYEEDIQRLLKKGATTLEVYDALTIADIRETCDLFSSVFEKTKGEHGFVSLEVLPCLAANTAVTIAEAKRLFSEVKRPNLMIKVPATPEGIPAVEALIAEGINVNVTLIFSQANYREVAEAYLSGLEKLAQRGGDLKKVHSVASVFVSRIDTDIDKQLDTKLGQENDAEKKSQLEALKGKSAIANTKMIYQEFKKIFGSSRFQSLKEKGAFVQKVLWGSTSTKNPAYPDLLYVEPLVGKDSVNTLPQVTWEALLDHGQIRPDAIEEDVAGCKDAIERLKSFGIDIHAVCDKLQKDGVKAFVNSFESLMAVLEKKSFAAIKSADPVRISYSLPEALEKAVGEAVKEQTGKDLHSRWLAKDPTIWTDDSAHHKVINNRLGWVDTCEKLIGRLYEVDLLREKIFAQKISDIVLLGMGGSSLAAEVMSLILGNSGDKVSGAPKGIRFHLLDTTDPLSISKVDKAIRYDSTIFVVGSKSGSTVETRSQYQYFIDAAKKFYNGDAQKAAGRFVIVTDDGSPLAAMGQKMDLAGLFLNPTDIGGRYSALSFFGFVPATLLGINLRKMLKDAQRVHDNMTVEKDLTKNEGIYLGIVLGALAAQGIDKMTFWTSPVLAPFSDWAEQLVAESTGKEGKGITPIAGEPILPLDRYSKNRVFVILRLKGESEKNWETRIKTLREKGFPVIDCVWSEGMNVGGEFLKWEIATSIAGVVLRINPYDEPNVKESKDITGRILESMKNNAPLPEPALRMTAGTAQLTPDDKKLLEQFFSKLKPEGYLSLLAYIDRTGAAKELLQDIQKTLAEALKVPALSGFGPRYLHSIGQLYKGGPRQGVFIEFLTQDKQDLNVPGEQYTFSQLKKAQALGDYEATSNKGLPVLVVDLGGDVMKGLKNFAEKVAVYFKQS